MVQWGKLFLTFVAGAIVSYLLGGTLVTGIVGIVVWYLLYKFWTKKK